MPVRKPKLGPVFAGIDVSKAVLTVCLRRDGALVERFEVANKQSGHKQLTSRLRKHGGCLRLVMEATSNFNLDLAFFLDKAELPLCIMNPRQARDFAGGLNRRAKTDKVDAAVLAEAAEVLNLPRWVAPPLEQLELRNIMRQVQSLTKRRTQLKCQLSAQRSAKCLGRVVIDSIKREINSVQLSIDLLLREARRIVRSLPQLDKDFKLLLTIKGIGELSALKLLAEIACLPPGLDVRQWVAWAGLDPRPRESGQHKPGRHLSKMGNRFLRAALFMPVLSSAFRKGPMQSYYNSLINRGKAKMVALCAGTRKLLHVVYGILKNQQPFNPDLFLRRA